MSILEETLPVPGYYGESVHSSVINRPRKRREPRQFDVRMRRNSERIHSGGEDPPSQEHTRSIRHEFYLASKRGLDIAGALFAIVLFAPVMLLAALLIKISDWGPVFFVQRRVGLNGREFNCIKFRSMIVGADKLQVHLEFHNAHDDPRTFKMPEDPRVNWIGRWLRRTSVDEMPQLFNVLIGDMSLVGPRPPVPGEVEQYDWDDFRRLEVKPGLTCIWQVSGRSRLPFSEQLRLDLQYIENRSLWLDMKLIFLTLPAVFSADGAY
jgi:lipopolysaccharide/colanic/teichoic acid biosynthesis glycosyltransferase